MPAGLSPDLGNIDVLARLFAPAVSEPAIGLAVSGGSDSLALMLLAQRWAASLPAAPRLFVYSLDHGLRPEAADEVAMVLKAATGLGIVSRGLRWTGEKPQAGIQEAAREARYRLIGEAMRADGTTLLLTGHHRTDQAETVLMRLAHGSGVEGLKGMSALTKVEGVRVFRPLLDIDPKSLASHVEAAGLVPAQDPGNSDPTYERVRWRRLFPALAAEGLDGAVIARFADRMAEADAAIAQMTTIAFEQLARLDGFGAARLPLPAFLKLTPAVGRRLLGRLLNIAGGRQKPRALGQVDRVYEQILDGDLSRAVTSLGAVIRIKGEDLLISREPGRALPEDEMLPPGAGLVWDERFLITNLSNETGLVAGAADYMPRHKLEQVLGFKVTSPAEAIRTAPFVRDAGGDMLALGGWSFDERIKVELLID